MRTFKAMFWKIRTGDKHTETVTAEDKRAARSIASTIFQEQFEDNGYLFAAFNEVFGARHGRPPRAN